MGVQTTTSPATTTTPAVARRGRNSDPSVERGVDRFTRRLFIGIDVVAMLVIPVVLLLVGLLDWPYLLIALALVIPALAAVPVALERRHRGLVSLR